MKIHPETAALAALVFASVGAAFWLTDTMTKDRARAPHDPLSDVVSIKSEPTNGAGFLTLTNSSPVPSWTIDPLTMQRESLAAGLRLGFAAACLGATTNDILKLENNIRAGRIDAVDNWFDHHPTQTR